jgi:hypothetical protein
MRLRYIILANLLVIALATIVILLTWNASEKPRSLFFNLSTELLGAVLIFILLNLLFPISDEKSILERISSTLDRIENKTPVFWDKEAIRNRFDFKSLLKDAKQLDILGYSCVNLIENHRGEITTAVINGTQIRILLVKPNSEAASLMSYHSKAKAYEPDMLKTQNRFKMTEDELANSPKKPKGSFKVKYTTWIPSCSLTIFNRKFDNGILKVKVYPIVYSTSTAEIAVHQVIKKQENKVWFDYFVNQYERLWNEYSCESSKETEVEIKPLM